MGYYTYVDSEASTLQVKAGAMPKLESQANKIIKKLNLGYEKPEDSEPLDFLFDLLGAELFENSMPTGLEDGKHYDAEDVLKAIKNHVEGRLIYIGEDGERFGFEVEEGVVYKLMAVVSYERIKY